MNKKITILIILICTLVVGIGVSLAYFAVNNQNDGNETNLNITTERLGSILWTGTKVFTSYDLLPGQIGIQEFTIEKNSESGHGIYEIDLAGVLAEEFGTDIEISLYKTTDPISNNVTVNVADPTLENETIYQNDSLNITGTPELVYQGTLTNNSQIILEQRDFDVTTLEKTTYYLVYHYKNNGNQDNQQGKSFSGTISVRIINEKMSFSEALALCDDTAANCMIKNAEKSEELVDDETVDHNLRFIGSDPDNYVWFNNELWRIIGVMNNIDDGTGKKESRLKIIGNEPYSTGMAWDIDDINDWSQASLQEELNTIYLNSIQNSYKEMIDNVVWNLGGTATTGDGRTNIFYERERGTTVYVGRPTEWTGKIALMYPSDYGYATSGGGIGRSFCLSYNLFGWHSHDECYNNDWLYKSGVSQWTLTSVTSYANGAFLIGSQGNIPHYSAFSTNNAVSPTLYLSSNVKITSGTGEENDPFILSL